MTRIAKSMADPRMTTTPESPRRDGWRVIGAVTPPAALRPRTPCRAAHRAGVRTTFALLALAVAPAGVLAQGQDSTPGERSVLIMAEMLPGLYDNSSQAMFDVRRGLPEADRHARTTVRITRVNAPAFGEYVFLWVTETGPDGAKQRGYRLATLTAGPGADDVTLRHYFRMQGEIRAEELATLKPADLRRTEGCDYVFRRRADHFRGLQGPKACRFEWEGQQVYTDNEISLAREGLWMHDHKYVIRTGRRITGVASGEPYALERARVFHCYADVPGVGGGRAIPFRRYDGITLHDKGDTHWLRTEETPPREVGLRLEAVSWPILNERGGNFNRDSLVLYVLQRAPDGRTESVAYAFTDPEATRIGHNLKWILVNCALTPRDQARPEM